MLKKKVATNIVASTRLCKCGEIVTLSAINRKTICPKCGAIVHEEKNDINTNNGETIHEKAKLTAKDNSAESNDSE